MGGGGDAHKGKNPFGHMNLKNFLLAFGQTGHFGVGSNKEAIGNLPRPFSGFVISTSTKMNH